jgi:hypothetical protein
MAFVVTRRPFCPLEAFTRSQRADVAAVSNHIEATVISAHGVFPYTSHRRLLKKADLKPLTIAFGELRHARVVVQQFAC